MRAQRPLEAFGQPCCARFLYHRGQIQIWPSEWKTLVISGTIRGQERLKSLSVYQSAIRIRLASMYLSFGQVDKTSEHLERAERQRKQAHDDEASLTAKLRRELRQTRQFANVSRLRNRD